MATVSGSDPTTDARSGGKIITNRRRRIASTPYDRPPPPKQQQQQSQGSPNWLTRVIFPATRMIASSTVKMISSVFDSSSSSSSSSSESQGDPDEDTENDVTNDVHYYHTDDVNHPNKECVISSEGMNFAKEPQQILLNSVTKSAIARLLMQERFSRKERDTLVEIIDSRIMDPIVGEGAGVMLADIPVGNVRYDATDLCSEAVTEARKWLEEKKVRSSPLSDMAHDSRTLHSVSLQHFENETGSPVDVAKLYMKSRPPWASPLVEHTEVRTPLALTRELFMEGASGSSNNGFLLSSKKRNSLVSGPWNIEEEIRRVRSKASEDMLSSPSTQIDLSSLQATPTSGKETVVHGVEGNTSNLRIDTQSVEASRSTAARLSSSIGISAGDIRQDNLENDTLKAPPAILSSDEFQDVEVFELTGGRAGLESKTSIHLDIGIEPCDDPRSSWRKVSEVDGIRESEVAGDVNGPDRNFCGEAAGSGDIHRQPVEGNLSGVKVGTETNSIQVEDTCELLSEGSVEVPIADETNGGIIDVMQSVSSVLHQDSTLATDKTVGAEDGATLKKEAKKSDRTYRRGRGRGRGK